MSASPVTLDFSKSQPVNAGVSLDFSKAKPLEEEKGFLDREIPLSSYRNATLSGMQSIGRGVRSAVKGIGNTLDPRPQDATEEGVSDAGGPLALPIYRTANGLAETVRGARQIPAAIHDINESPDPLGTYLKAGQETAGEGAGQALVALGTEGVGRGVAKLGPPVVRGVARGTNAVLEKAPGTIGAGAGAAIGHATGIPGASELGGALGYGVGREILPRIKIPGEHFPFPDRVTGGPEVAPAYEPPPPFRDPGASLPEAPPAEVSQASSLHRGVKPVEDRAAGLGQVPVRRSIASFKDPGASLPEKPAPELIKANNLLSGVKPVEDRAAGLGSIPVREPGAAGSMIDSVAKPSAITPGPAAADTSRPNIGRLLNDSLGGKPLERGVPIGKQRPLGNVPEQIKETVPPSKQAVRAPLGNVAQQIKSSSVALPKDFTPTPDSSLLKGYKYDSEAREFHAVLNNGESYTHGEVTPEQFEAFKSADSQGSAWTKQIKQGAGTVLVKKNGAPVKPLASATASPLEDQLQDMLRQAKGGKKLRDMAAQ